MGILQKIKTVLLPEIGLDLEPDFVKEFKVDTDFSRTLAHLVGRTGKRSIMVRATSDGRLLVAAAGTAMEIYEVVTGVAPDPPPNWTEYERENAVYVTDFLIEAFDAVVQFRNAVGDWGNSIIVPVGYFSKDLIHYGVRIQNRVALSVAEYEIVMYR